MPDRRPNEVGTLPYLVTNCASHLRRWVPGPQVAERSMGFGWHSRSERLKARRLGMMGATRSKS